jgi:hypothetical protein
MSEAESPTTGSTAAHTRQQPAGDTQAGRRPLSWFLAPKDDGWTAHEPSKGYINKDTFATAAT